MTAIAAPIRAVLDLFQSSLADVRFADLDAARLQSLASEVEAAAVELNTRQAALDAARATLTERQESLALQVQRAVAYARVYAENDAALSEQLNAIALPRAAKRAARESAPRTARAALAQGVEKPDEAVTETAAAAEPAPEAPGVEASDAEPVELGAAPPKRSKRKDAVRTVVRDDSNAEA